MKGILCFVAALVIGTVLASFSSAASPADKDNALPARVEGSQVNPPATVFTAAEARQADLDAAEKERLIKSIVENRFALIGPDAPTPVSTAAAAVSGQPVRNAGRVLFGGARRGLRFLFRGRSGRGGCG